MTKSNCILFLMASAILTLSGSSAEARMVISQFSFGSDESHKDEYVEIYNISIDEIMDISLWRLQYRATRAMPWRTIAVIPEDTYLPPRTFYLIAPKGYSPDNVAPDMAGSFGLGISGEGSLRIIDFDGVVSDLVGYGTASPEAENRPITSILGQVIIRRDPLKDSNDNSKDFRSQTARTPRNMGGIARRGEPQRVSETESRIETESVEESREIARKNNSVRSEFLLGEARDAHRRRRWLTAYEKSKKSLLLAPDNEEARSFQSRIVEEVKRKLERRSLVGPDEFYGRAFLFYTRADWQRAANELRKILVLKPEHAEAREYYGKIRELILQGQQPQKKTTADGQTFTFEIEDDRPEPKRKPPQRVRRAKPSASETKEPSVPTARAGESADELYDKGLTEFAEGRLTEAIRLWEQTLRYNPNHRRAQKALSRARRRIDGQ